MFYNLYDAESFCASGKYKGNTVIKHYKKYSNATEQSTVPLFENIAEYNKLVDTVREKVYDNLIKTLTNKLKFSLDHVSFKILGKPIPGVELKFNIGQTVFPNNKHAACETESLNNQFSGHFNIPKYSGTGIYKKGWLHTAYEVAGIAVATFQRYDNTDTLTSYNETVYYCISKDKKIHIVCTGDNLSEVDLETYNRNTFNIS